jgi:hypothetical protein
MLAGLIETIVPDYIAVIASTENITSEVIELAG